MVEALVEELEGGGVSRFRLLRDGVPMQAAQVLEAWQHDGRFVEQFVLLLREAPYRAYFFETPPIDISNAERDFEFVLVDSPTLAGVSAEAGPFAGQFERGTGSQVIGFASLGGDAYLIAPCPQGPSERYAHLAAFAREADMDVQRALWREVGRATAERLDTRPLWVSTSGLGVYWLHVRLDTRPKYYTYRPYREGGEHR